MLPVHQPIAALLLKGRIVTCLRLQGLLCSLFLFFCLILVGWCSSLCSLSHQSYVLKSTRFPYTLLYASWQKKKDCPSYFTLSHWIKLQKNFRKAWEDGLWNEDVLYSDARPSLSNRSMCAFQNPIYYYFIILGLTKSGVKEWYY